MALLSLTAPGVRSRAPEGEPAEVTRARTHWSVTEGAVAVAETVFSRSDGMLVKPLAVTAVPVRIVTYVPRLREEGAATWYDAPDGTCAHVTLPFDTMVTVTRVSSGASTQCRVADRGPFGEGRVVDMSIDTFEELGHTSEGMMEVHLKW